MDYIKGGDLKLLLKKHKRFSEEMVIFYAVQIVDAIGYFHKNDIIHRDLNLEKVLVKEDGYVTLIDFST